MPKFKCTNDVDPCINYTDNIIVEMPLTQEQPLCEKCQGAMIQVADGGGAGKKLLALGMIGAAFLIILVSAYLAFFRAEFHITSPSEADAFVNTPFTYQIVTSGNAAKFEVADLPPGWTFSSDIGEISGSPAKVGTIEINISATDESDHRAEKLLTIITKPAEDDSKVPARDFKITSAQTVNATLGQEFRYQITATKVPTNFAVDLLPDGWNLSATGLLTGKPNALGSISLTISASNDAGEKASSKLVIAVRTSQPPAPADKSAVKIISGAVANGYVGVPFSYEIMATGNPTHFNVSPLPAGWSVSDRGVIQGTPSKPEVIALTVSASNGLSEDKVSVRLTVFTDSGTPGRNQIKVLSRTLVTDLYDLATKLQYLKEIETTPFNDPGVQQAALRRTKDDIYKRSLSIMEDVGELQKFPDAEMTDQAMQDSLDFYTKQATTTHSFVPFAQFLKSKWRSTKDAKALEGEYETLLTSKKGL